MSYQKFTLSVLISVVLIIFTTGIITRIVDPYGAFHKPELAGFNTQKTQAAPKLRISKAFLLRDHDFDTLVLGSSKVLRGIDPSSQYFGSEKNVYNLGLSGPRIDEILNYMVHANYSGQIKEVFLFLDLTMFNMENGTNSGYTPKRLRSGEHRSTQHLHDLAGIIFSIEALHDSLETISKQMSGSEYISSGGMERNIKHHEDIAYAFENTEKRYLTHNWPASKGSFSLVSPKENSIDYYADIVRYCLENSINLKVAFSPMHARLLEALHSANLWDKFETWKREVVRVTSDISSDTDQSNNGVYDYAIYNDLNQLSIHSENLPKHYFESTHFTPVYGDIMIREISLHSMARANPLQANVVNALNISDHLSTQRQSRIDFNIKFSETINTIRKIAIAAGHSPST